MRTLLLILAAVLLSGCDLFDPKPPKTFTAAPSIGTAQKGVTDAKDFLSRAQHRNDQIEEELDALEKELQ